MNLVSVEYRWTARSNGWPFLNSGRALRSFFLLICFYLFAANIFAQLGNGVFQGLVTDNTGSAIPGANVSMTNIATKESLTAKTNGVGRFNSPPLNPGTYRIEVKQNGFTTEVQTNLVLPVGGRIDADFTLAIGSTSDTVTVTGRPEDLNTTNAALGVLFDSKPISELPVNSRSALALTALTPGVRSPFGSDIQGQGDRGDQVYAVQINGAPAGAPILADGINLQLLTNAETNVNATVDALAEFKVESGTLDAQYGMTAGGVINMVTKSGTEHYHGSVYEYLRNDVFDSRNYFLPTTSRKPKFRYNQFGATLGGKIVHEKAFFFANFEAYRYIKGAPSTTTVPSLKERAGDFSEVTTPLFDPFTTRNNPSGAGLVRTAFLNNNVSARIDPVALNYQNTFYPLPNTGTGITNNYTGIVNTRNNMNQGVGRIDYRLSQANNAFARYWYYQYQTNNPSLFNQAFWRADNMRNQNLAVGDTHVFSSNLVNDFRAGGTLNIFSFMPGGNGQNWPQKLGLPSSVPNEQLPVMNNGELTPNTTGGRRGRVRFEMTDIATLNVRTHALSVGFDYRLSTDSSNTLSAQSGSYTYAASTTNNPQQTSGTGNQYASFLIGAVSAASFTSGLGTTDRQNTIAAFVQDNWRTTRNLSLNFGLRYDYQQQPFEQNNHYSNFNPTLVDSVNGLTGAYQYAGVGAGRSFLAENVTNFGPRAAFAYSFGPKRQSVVRGGYAIYYALQIGPGFAGNPSGFSNTTSYGPVDAYTVFQLQSGIPYQPVAPLGAGLGPAAFLGQSVTYTNPHAPSPSSQQMNLTLQQALGHGLVLQASGVRNFGEHFPTTGYNLNVLNPSYLSMGTALTTQVTNPYYGIVPATGAVATGKTISIAQSLLPFPYYQNVNGNYNHIGWYIAHYGEFQLTERTGKGLTLLAAYTIGKELDNIIYLNSAPVSQGIVMYSQGGYQNIYNLKGDRSLDGTDVSQRATASILYDVPFGRGRRFVPSHAWLDEVAGGWQVDTITVLQSGVPLGITGGNGTASTRPNFNPGQSVKLGNPSFTQWFNTAAFISAPAYTFGNVPRELANVRSQGTANVDLSLIKEFHVYHENRLSFRTEFFNILNHPSLGKPNTSFVAGTNGLNATSNSSFGTITQTNIDNRQIQLALKYLF